MLFPNGEVDFVESNPYPVEYGGSAVWEGKFIYLVGMEMDIQTEFIKFDPFNNSGLDWLTAGSKQTSGKVIDGILYTFGGYNGAVSTSIHAYDIEQFIWMIWLHKCWYLSSFNSSSGDYLLVIGDYAGSIAGLYDPVEYFFSN